MNKTAIKNVAISARKKLIAMAIDKAGIIGITKDAVAEPTSRGGDFAVFPTHFGTQTRLDGAQLRQRENLVHQITEKGYDSVMEEVAYTWFNRLIAVRFMEVNDYLPTRVRVLSSETAGKAEPDLVTLAPNVELGFTPAEVEEIYALKDDPRKSGELFKKLFIKQCNALGEILPELFEHTADYTELLLDLSWDKEDGVVRELLTVDEADFREAVEIIGWMYQYYNTEPKQTVFDGLKKNVKITKENIPAATQLFTPDWIVRYMVENSLGRLWVEGHPNDGLKAQWRYYLEEARQELEVMAQLAAIREEYKALNPEGIKVIDPCMGSGHILVYAFDVLMQIYVSCGYAERDAARHILEKNLYGLDIDKRAYQLSYFAVMMKGRQYDRRFLTRGVLPQLYCPAGCPDGEEFGSLLRVDELESRPEEPRELTLFSMDYVKELNTWNFRRLLAQKYDVVVTNPPYMGSSGMGAKLSEFVKNNYPDSKSDLSTAFMEQTLYLCKPTGFMAMINIPVWMFITSYKALRSNLLRNNKIVNMLHFGRGVFGSDFGSTAFVISKANVEGYIAVFQKLYLVHGAVDTVGQKEQWFFEGIGKYTVSQSQFLKIPSTPLAYWVSSNFINSFTDGKLIGKLGQVSEGIKTGDNDRFLRYWYEIQSPKFSFAQKAAEYKWVPYHKGGDFRKWFGNNTYAINWGNDGQEIRSQSNSGLQGKSMYFTSVVGYSKISARGNPMRYFDEGVLFDSMAPSILLSKRQLYVLGLLNTVVGIHYIRVLNPTMATQVGDIKNIPVIVKESETVENIVKSNISLSRTDWDNFETSWDFKRHPLL